MHFCAETIKTEENILEYLQTDEKSQKSVNLFVYIKKK